MTPMDSASVRFAAGVPVDSLEHVWTAHAPESLSLPTSIGWMYPDSANTRLVVIETQRAEVHFFSGSGEHESVWSLEDAESYPYLAGISGDTVIVLNRGLGEIAWLQEGRVVRRVDAPEGSEAALVSGRIWATRTGGGERGRAKLHVLHDKNAASWETHSMVGSPWRSLGFLRLWGDTLLALSGYRPVVDVLRLPASLEAPLDTMALYGFDSPQLVRSYQFMQGDVKQPPLLTSSAVPLGNSLFVLNMRADHIRIDEYDRSGTLQRVFVSSGSGEALDAYPADLAIRNSEKGREIAVLMQRRGGFLRHADARIELFRLPG